MGDLKTWLLLKEKISVIKRIKFELHLLKLFKEALQLHFGEFDLNWFIDYGFLVRVLAVCMHVFLHVEGKAKLRCANIPLNYVSLLKELRIMTQNGVVWFLNLSVFQRHWKLVIEVFQDWVGANLLLLLEVELCFLLERFNLIH